MGCRVYSTTAPKEMIIGCLVRNQAECVLKLFLKELRHDILNHFFDGLNIGSIVGKPKNNGLLRKKNTKGVILKGTRMDEDEEV